MPGIRALNSEPMPPEVNVDPMNAPMMYPTPPMMENTTA